MPKHKPKRSSPSLDMTAMCDVAFLLLTFFMLTAKMKPQETVTVDTPSSISETKLPDVGTLGILVSKEGNVFIDPTGQHARLKLIEFMNSNYSLNLTPEEKKRFANSGSFGVPMNQVKKMLSSEAHEKEKYNIGIPIDTADINKSELAQWIHQARIAQNEYRKEKAAEGNESQKDYAIVVKADKDTPYPAISKVINTLTDINVFKFNLITTQEADPNKPAEGGGE
jgi:biopolymer transport protein ExbD